MSRAERAERRSLRVTATLSEAVKRRRMTDDEDGEAQDRGRQEPETAPSAMAIGDDEYISLTVTHPSDGAPEMFRIKKTTSFRKLMDAYCKKLGFDKQAIRFCFQGKRLLEQDTPKACGIEDGDDIDIYYRQPFGYGGPSVSMRSSCTSNPQPTSASVPSKKADEDSSSSDSSGVEGEENKPVVEKKCPLKKTAANELSKVLNVLESTLECPVCLNLPRDLPVPSCPSGHIVCRSCRPQVADNKCPTCRQQMSANMTNSVVGCLIEQVEHSCKFGDQGCEVKMRLKEIKAHEKSCLKRTVKCAFKNCGVDVMLNEFNSHLITSHSSVPENLEYGVLVKEISLNLKNLSFGHNFYPILQYYRRTHCFVFSVWTDESKNIAQQYRAKLTIKGRMRNQNELNFNSIHVTSVEDVPSIDRCMEENGKQFLCLPWGMVRNIGINPYSSLRFVDLEISEV